MSAPFAAASSIGTKSRDQRLTHRSCGADHTANLAREGAHQIRRLVASGYGCFTPSSVG
jgi:hypothetical protein